MFRNKSPHRLVLIAVVVALSACSAGEDTTLARSSVSDEQARIQLKSFLDAQMLARASLSLEPADHDWRFLQLADLRRTAADTGKAPVSSSSAVLITYRSEVPGTRVCHRVGAYDVRVPARDDCPGDWLAYRADSRSTGASTFRLNWNAAPREVASVSLQVEQQADPLRVFAHHDPQMGERLYVNNGSALEAFDRDGRRVWRTPGLGIGEIIDVADLDDDGAYEVIFSPGSRWNMLNPSGAGPGELIIVSAASGEVLWQHSFVGIEFGLNRRRTTIAANPNGTGKSLYAVMTYSPHLWRFDFSAGVRNGRLSWKSPPMIYDSPDKAPLVADFDGDGTPEVVVDCYGTLYRFRLSDGVRLSQTPYAADRYSFGGFLAATDLDGDGRPEIVGLSNSVYMKDAFAAEFDDGAFRVIWRREWEHGLETTSFEVRELRGLIKPNGSSRQFLVWSARDLRHSPSQHSLELVDAANGQLVDRMEAALLVGLLRSPDGAYRVATKRGENEFALTQITASGLGQTTTVPALQWNGLARLGRPSYMNDNSQTSSVALIKDADGRNALLRLDAGDVVKVQELASAPGVLDGPLVHFENVAGHLAMGRSGQISRITGATVEAPSAVFVPKVFGVPIAADLDGDGRREIVLPYQRGTGIARMLDRQNKRIDTLIQRAPEQQRESFHIPLIVRSGTTTSAGGDRIVVGFKKEAAQVSLLALDTRTDRIWSWVLPSTNWEPSLVLGSDTDGKQTVFYNDSRMTMAFEPATGTVRWTMDSLGQCQRQIAALDWNGDGIADVALQAGETVYVVNGKEGVSFSQSLARTSYGGYVAAISNTGIPAVGVFGAGGVTLVDARDGILIDRQLDERKVESIPPVVGRLHAKGGAALFQVSGAGVLRRLSSDGSDQVEVDLKVPALTMTGAFVDSDDYVDLLVSTYRGEVIAVSGATMEELWRVQLDGAAGPAVATDIDGDGRGEIAVITSDGSLRILALDPARHLPGRAPP